MKRLLGSLLILSLAPVFLSAQEQIIDRVVATVGGELVLLSEVEEQFSYTKSRAADVPESARCMIVEQLLANKLLIHQAKLDSIEVLDAEVENQLDARIERILTYMNNDVSQFEAFYGQTITDVKDQFREDIRQQLLMERMRSQIMQNVTVTPSEVKAFFESIPTDSLPYFSSEVEVAEIVHKPEVNEVEKQKAIDLLEDLRKRILDDGEDFAELAAKYSDDGSARLGGDLGWSTRGKFVPEFEAAAYTLEKNELSPIVETEFGFHLIQMLERRGNSIKVRHILVRPEITDADLVKAEHYIDSIRQLIQTDSTLSFSIAVKVFGNEDVQSYNNDGRIVNPLTGNNFFEVSDLDPDIYFAIDTMEIGDISKPLEFDSPSGETMYRIVQLQSRTQPHRASLETDYFKIQTAAIESKRNEFINEWVEERISNTFISIEGLYDGCPNLASWEKRSAIRP